jgi:hypothetical protein
VEAGFSKNNSTEMTQIQAKQLSLSEQQRLDRRKMEKKFAVNAIDGNNAYN